jgi:hypothetical protein
MFFTLKQRLLIIPFTPVTWGWAPPSLSPVWTNHGYSGRYADIEYKYTCVAPAGGAVAAAQEGGALAFPSALTPTSSWWVLIAL